MTETHGFSPEPGKGPHAMIADYLQRRSPARLAADAAALMLLTSVCSHLWTATSDTMEPAARSQPAPTLLAAVARPQALLGTLYTVLFHLTWMLFAWAGIRLLAGALATCQTHREG
jgi:hypothetical protein